MRQVRVTKRVKRRQQDEQAPETTPARPAARPPIADLLGRIGDLLRDGAS